MKWDTARNIKEWCMMIAPIVKKIGERRRDNMIPKFRAWHKKEKRWEIDNDIRISPEGIVYVWCLVKEVTYGTPTQIDREYKWVVTNDYDIVWFTGRKDKNGKEIFEGDIIIHKNGYVYAVEKPSPPNFWWSLCPHKNTPTGGICGQDMRLHICKVIGNSKEREGRAIVYENPESLKKGEMKP